MSYRTVDLHFLVNEGSHAGQAHLLSRETVTPTRQAQSPIAIASSENPGWLLLRKEGNRMNIKKPWKNIAFMR